MPKKRRGSWAWLVGALLLVAAGVGAQDAADADLQAELDAILRELHGEWGTTDVFADGREPDLLVVSMTDVRGEVAPCG